MMEKMIQKRMIYREGEGIIANINRPTLAVYEIDCSEVKIKDLFSFDSNCKPCKETFLRMEGPEILPSSSEVERLPVKERVGIS